MLKYVVVLVAFSMGASGQHPVNTKTCEAIQTSLKAVDPFDLKQFAGQWIEVERVKNPAQGICASINVKDTTLKVDYSHVMKKTEIKTPMSPADYINVTYDVTRETTEPTAAKLSTSIASEIYPIWVLSTDYKNYALVYSCHKKGDADSYVYMSKLSRNTTLSAQDVTKINTVVSANTDLKGAIFESITHSKDVCGGAYNLRAYTFSLAAVVLTSILVIS